MINLLKRDTVREDRPKEGDLYKSVTIHGKTFDIFYGYYEEFERQYNDPMPVYPNFLEKPVYTAEGIPFATQMQDACRHYAGKAAGDRECAGCIHFAHREELMGLCLAPARRCNNETEGDPHDR